MLKLQFIGFDDWDRPVYRDEKERVWKDVDPSDGHNPDLHKSSTNEYDGEPDYRYEGEFEIVNREDIPDRKNSFQYMMLSRLKSDCNYFTGYGHTMPLSTEDVDYIINEMRTLWNGFADSEKPEWLTMEQIDEYEKALRCPVRINKYLTEDG